MWSCRPRRRCGIPGKSRPVLRSFRFAVPPPAPGVPGEVAAISAAVGRLADGIAPMLTAHHWASGGAVRG